jgi:hypothetical protein
MNRVVSGFKASDYKPVVRKAEVNKQLEKLLKRKAELKLIVKQMIEKNALGTLADDMYDDKAREYQTERGVVENGIKECHIALASDPKMCANQFVELIKGRRLHKTLEREDVLRLIDKIIVHECDGGKNVKTNRSQLVDIYFRHVGMIGDAIMVG